MHRGSHTHRRARFARRMMTRRYARHMSAMGRSPWMDEGPSPVDKLRFLEEYQRDLEQEVADVASRIAELKDEIETPTDA